MLEKQKRIKPLVEPILDGDGEAQLTKLACSTPANGHARWSLRLLADQLAVLEIVDAISHATVWRALRKLIETVKESDVVHVEFMEAGSSGLMPIAHPEKIMGCLSSSRRRGKRNMSTTSAPPVSPV